MGTKHMAIHAALKMGYTVIWSDTDAVWMNHCAWNYLTHAPSNIDLLAQRGTSPPTIAIRIGVALCAGFFMVRPTNSSIQLIHNVVYDIFNRRRDDQLSLNFVANEMGGLNFTRFLDYYNSDGVMDITNASTSGELTIGFLPYKQFPRGYIPPNFRHTRRRRKKPKYLQYAELRSTLRSIINDTTPYSHSDFSSDLGSSRLADTSYRDMKDLHNQRIRMMPDQRLFANAAVTAPYAAASSNARLKQEKQRQMALARKRLHGVRMGDGVRVNMNVNYPLDPEAEPEARNSPYPNGAPKDRRRFPRAKRGQIWRARRRQNRPSAGDDVGEGATPPLSALIGDHSSDSIEMSRYRRLREYAENRAEDVDFVTAATADAMNSDAATTDVLVADEKKEADAVATAETTEVIETAAETVTEAVAAAAAAAAAAADETDIKVLGERMSTATGAADERKDEERGEGEEEDKEEKEKEGEEVGGVEGAPISRPAGNATETFINETGLAVILADEWKVLASRACLWHRLADKSGGSKTAALRRDGVLLMNDSWLAMVESGNVSVTQVQQYLYG
jgi:hypothetical protein